MKPHGKLETYWQVKGTDSEGRRRKKIDIQKHEKEESALITPETADAIGPKGKKGNPYVSVERKIRRGGLTTRR